MNVRSKSTLFLIEQLIVIAVFAICATACIRIVTNAYFFAKDSRDVSNALIVAQSGADSFKAVSGDFEKAAELLGGTVWHKPNPDTLVVYYDDRWQVSGEDSAFYILFLIADRRYVQPHSLVVGELTVEKISGEELISIPVAVIG